MPCSPEIGPNSTERTRAGRRARAAMAAAATGLLTVATLTVTGPAGATAQKTTVTTVSTVPGGVDRLAPPNPVPSASPPLSPLTVDTSSYSLLTSSGGLVGYGAALTAAPLDSGASVAGVAATLDGLGAVVVERNGSVITRGDASFAGSAAGLILRQPIVGVALDAATGGYWLVGSDGGIFSFNAPFFGSTGAMRLNKPIVGISATPDGMGYRLVASDGGIFDFGDAGFYGSTGALRLNKPIVGMSATPDGMGYRLVASDGGIFDFGDAGFYGSTGALALARPIVGMAATADNDGYWLVAADGGIFTFGDAVFYGSGAGLNQSVIGMAVEAGGYQNPLRSVTKLEPERVDQGVDYAGAGPIYAIGDGIVRNTTNPGWPGGAFISYQLTDGPAAGKVVYVAENVIPSVTVGQTVNASTQLGMLVDAYPYLETGWADPPGLGDTLAMANDQWSTTAESASLATAYGANFSQMLAALGAPPGLMSLPLQGTLPAGWPAWSSP
jgi:hypothetical protein